MKVMNLCHVQRASAIVHCLFYLLLFSLGGGGGGGGCQSILNGKTQDGIQLFYQQKIWWMIP